MISLKDFVDGYHEDEYGKTVVVESLQENEETKKELNKPFRLAKGSDKKFGVYVKNDKGNVVKVTFGDPNMEIKRDDDERRKSFRARHGCDKDPGPKWKAKYWSCRMWEKGKSVSDVLSEEELLETPSPPIGKDEKTFQKLADKYNFKVKKIGSIGVYELEYKGNFMGLFDPRVESEDKLEVYSRIAKKKFG